MWYRRVVVRMPLRVWAMMWTVKAPLGSERRLTRTPLRPARRVGTACPAMVTRALRIRGECARWIRMVRPDRHSVRAPVGEEVGVPVGWTQTLGSSRRLKNPVVASVYQTSRRAGSNAGCERAKSAAVAPGLDDAVGGDM